MRWLFALIVLVHALIHFLGFAKAFQFAELPQLSQPISRLAGAAWVAAGLMLIVAAVSFLVAPRLWWLPGAIGVILSQLVITSSWSDAKFGTIANVVIALGVLHGFASRGPTSFQAHYDQRVADRLRRPLARTAVTESDLAALPRPVTCYLRSVGVVGQPRPRYLTASMRGRIRGAPEDPWMHFTAEQHNFLDEPARFFLMRASRKGLPVEVLHAFEEGAATMKVRLLSLFPVLSSSGADMTRAETVTLLNDIAILAPGALIDPSLQWEPVDDRSARVRYTVGQQTIGATLIFNESCELVNFVSDDRLADVAGKGLTPMRWSTPLRDYRQFGPVRLAGQGQGIWHPASGEFSYIELEFLDVRTGPD